MNISATCVSVAFNVEIGPVIFECQFVITMMNRFSFFVHGSGPSISITINSGGPNAGNICKCPFRLARSLSREHVAKVVTVCLKSFAICD